MYGIGNVNVESITLLIIQTISDWAKQALLYNYMYLKQVLPFT